MSQQATGHGFETLGSSRYISSTYKGECDVWGLPKIRRSFDGPTPEERNYMESFLSQMAQDAEDAHWRHHYVPSEDVARMLEAVKTFESAGAYVPMGLENRIKSLDWYVPMDSSKVVQCQRALNEVNDFTFLTEDGIYGYKTADAWRDFASNIISGSVPSLTYLDPLQSKLTEIETKPSNVTRAKSEIDDSFLPASYDSTVFLKNNSAKKERVFMLDKPHKPYYYYHMNTTKADFGLKRYFYDHKEITPQAYRRLHDLAPTGKIVRTSGRTLLVAGAALDAIEMGQALHDDWTSDSRNFHHSISTSFDIVGSWGGGAVGGKLGAMGGATVGTMLLPGAGTLVGGAVGGLVLGIAGSFGGEKLAQWVLDITDLVE